MTYGINDVLSFGKHKGSTIDQILDHDPSYLDWLDRKHIIDISPDILDAAHESMIERSCAYGDPQDFYENYY